MVNKQLEDDEKQLIKHDDGLLHVKDEDSKERSAIFSSIEQSKEVNGNCCQNKIVSKFFS